MKNNSVYKQVKQLIEDDDFCLQEHISGKKISIGVDSGVVTAFDSGPAGDKIELPNEIKKDLTVLCQYDIGLVGTLVGDKLCVEDIFRLDGADVVTESFKNRYYLLQDVISDHALALSGSLEIVPAFFDFEMKEEKLEAIRGRNGDGVSFRNVDQGAPLVFEFNSPATDLSSKKRKP